MKILHLTKRYPNSMGGDAIVVSNYERYQRASGHKVWILTSNCKQITKKNNVIKFGIPLSNQAIDSINLQRIATLLALFFYSFWLLRKIKPDVIHSHSSDMGFFISVAAKAYRIPVVNTSHGISFNLSKFFFVKRALEKFLLKGARHNKYITVDIDSVDAFHSIGIKNVVYIPNGVESKNYRPSKLRKEVVNILFVGRLVWPKGLEYLLEAFSELATEVPGLHLNLIGTGAGRDDYVRLVKSYGLSEKVSFLGKVGIEKMPASYAANDIFVLSSLHEGFPLVILEAWATGLPVVTTKVGACSKVCHHGMDALLVDPGKADQIKDALLQLIQDFDLRKTLQKNGHKQIRDYYNYDLITKEVEKIYNEVVQ